MDNLKLAAIMYIAAGGLFAVTSILGGNFLLLPVGAFLLLLGFRKLKETRGDGDQNPEQGW